MNSVIFGKCYVIVAWEKKEKEDTFFGNYILLQVYTRENQRKYANLQLDEKKKPIQNHAINIKL